MEWIIENKDWLFSGVLITIPLAVLGWVFTKRTASRSQNQNSGNNSTNIQADGNVNFHSVTKDERPESDSRR